MSPRQLGAGRGANTDEGSVRDCHMLVNHDLSSSAIHFKARRTRSNAEGLGPERSRPSRVRPPIRKLKPDHYVDGARTALLNDTTVILY